MNEVIFEPEFALVRKQAKRYTTALLILGALTLGGSFTPLVFKFSQRVNIALLGVASVSSVIFTLTSKRFEEVVGLYVILKKGQTEARNNALIHNLAFTTAIEQIQAKQLLANAITTLTPVEQSFYSNAFGVPLPVTPVEVLPPEPTDNKIVLSKSTDSTDVKIYQETAPANLGIDEDLQILQSIHPSLIRFNWIPDLIQSSMHPDLSKRANHHFYLVGVTQSGKTSLAGLFVNLIAACSSGAEIYAHDPKKFPNQPDISNWGCSFTRKFDGFAATPSWISFVNERINSRTKEFNPSLECRELIYIQDEVDMCYGEGKGTVDVSKRDAERLHLMWQKIICYTAGSRSHGVFMGQSPLTQANGFNKPTLDQLCFIAIRKTANYLLNHASIYLNELSDEEVQILKEIVDVCLNLGVRFALVRPTDSKPFIGIIPTIEYQDI